MGQSSENSLKIGQVDPPAKMAIILLIIGAIVIFPCLVTYLTGQRLWLVSWPATIWAALYVVQITEPRSGGERPSPQASLGAADIQFGTNQPFSEFEHRT